MVGLIAISLYLRQRLDHKSDAAKLILQEIRYAEQVFKASTQGNRTDFLLYEKMLPTNNWNQNIHLFLELEETELDLINRFYSKAAYIDHLVSKISDFKNKQTEFVPVQQQPVQPKVIIQQSMQPIQPGNLQLIPTTLDLMETTQELLRIVRDEMESVYNTPTGEKLKRLSRKKPLLNFF